MSHLSPLHLVLLPSWVLNAKTKNGHQQGGVIDGADILRLHLSKYLVTSVFCPQRLSSLLSSLSLQLYPSYTEQSHSLSPSLFMCLWQRNSNPGPLVCLPFFTPLPACILMYICKVRGPAPLIRSTAWLKRIHRERWRYLLLSTCPPCPPTVLVINDVSHIRGALSDMDSPTKQSQG